jgi:subtilase family serine protease
MSLPKNAREISMRLIGNAKTLWRRRWAAALVLAALGAGAAHAAPQPLLTTHVPAAVASNLAPLVGRPDPEQTLHLAIALPMRNQAELVALLRQIYNPASPFYRHYLSVAEFTRRFGPLEFDYAAAVNFFANSRLQVTGVSANRYIIDVVGTVAETERVFHVKMGLYKHPTEARNFIAPDREPTLDLNVPVLHVTGLDDFTLPAPRLIHANTEPAGRLTGSGPKGYFIGSDIRAAYYGGSALTGAGQSLGLMELKGYNIADVNAYFTKFGPPLTVAVNGISTDGTSLLCDKKCDDSEQVLDIEYAISMAPGMTQVQVYVANSPESVLNRMASDNATKQLSTSWGWGNNFATDDPIFLEMAAQGQTFLTASGDDSTLKASGPWPEEDANLTAVGGTDLTTSGPGGFWVSETGWADSAGGPSLDRKIKIESYQLPFIDKANAGSTTLRNVPDIAGDANTDNYICYNGRCDGGWGGTSFASPIWAGFIALANEQAAANGKGPVGFLNLTLYGLAGGSTYSTILHDETRGKSGIYKCVAGYDLVTGLGSPYSQALINALTGMP